LVLKWFRAFLASNKCPCFCLVLFWPENFLLKHKLLRFKLLLHIVL
jgi:hypothetical protein